MYDPHGSYLGLHQVDRASTAAGYCAADSQLSASRALARIWHSEPYAGAGNRIQPHETNPALGRVLPAQGRLRWWWKVVDSNHRRRSRRFYRRPTLTRYGEFDTAPGRSPPDRSMGGAPPRSSGPGGCRSARTRSRKARSVPSTKSWSTGPIYQRDGLRGARRHHEATLPCHQQKQQTVTAAWAGWKPFCLIGNSGPIVH